MGVKDIKGYDLEYLLDRLNQIKGEGDNIKATFQDYNIDFPAFEFREIITVLLNIVKMEHEYPEQTRKGFINHSIFKISETDDLNEENFIKEIERQEAEYLSKPLKKFVIVTHISIPNHYKLTRRRINDVTVTFPASLNKRFVNSRKPKLDQYSRWVKIDLSEHHRPIKVFVNARSENDAYLKGMKHFNFLRAIWNFTINSMTSARITEFPKPVNQILTGPVYTIHQKDGSLSSNLYWFEPDFHSNFRPLKKGKFQKAIEVESKRRNQVNRIKNSKYKNYIEEVLRNYCNSLDRRDLNNAFLDLWSTIEMFITPGNKANHQQIIDRLTFLFQKEKYHEIILQHLRDYRNVYVHENNESHEIETYTYQLKSYLEKLIYFNLMHANKFDHIGDFHQFLDQPHGEENLKKKRKLAEQALKIL